MTYATLEEAEAMAEKLRMCMSEAGYKLGADGDVIVHHHKDGIHTCWVDLGASSDGTEDWWRARELSEAQFPVCLKHFYLGQADICRAKQRVMKDCSA